MQTRPILAATLVLLAGCHHDASTGGAQPVRTAPPPEPVAEASRKIDDRVLRATSASTTDSGSTGVPVDASGRLQVYVRCTLGDADTQRQSLQSSGLMITAQADVGGSRLVEGWIDPAALQALAALDFVERISPPRQGQPRR
jgi:hypothetical protein